MPCSSPRAVSFPIHRPFLPFTPSRGVPHIQHMIFPGETHLSCDFSVFLSPSGKSNQTSVRGTISDLRLKILTGAMADSDGQILSPSHYFLSDLIGNVIPLSPCYGLSRVHCQGRRSTGSVSSYLYREELVKYQPWFIF